MTHADPVETLRRLEEWHKKYRHLKLESAFVSGLSQVVTCTLKEVQGNKEVFAVDYELWDPGITDRSTEFHPTICDVIKLALDRWDGLVPQYGEEDA